MPAYTWSSRYTAAAEKEKLWDPSKTLGIINADSGYECITCVGYAPSKRRRCLNPIRADNRQFITQTLDDIAYLPPDSPAVLSKLRAIAGPALCVRYHQNQAQTVVLQWQRKIQQLRPSLSERKPVKPIQSSKKEASLQDQSMKDILERVREMQELLAGLQEEVNSQRYQDQEYEPQESQAARDRREEQRRRSEEKDREARRKAKERLEKEQLEKEIREREEQKRLEKERLEKERREREEKLERERETAAHNERLRQRAQKVREEREREKRDQEQKEKEEWNQSWTRYQEGWVNFRAATSVSRERRFRDAIPWPVKSGSHHDVKASNVTEFFQNAVPKDTNMAKVMRKECLKWHSDARCRLPLADQLTEGEKMMLDMICRVVTDLLNKSG